jgi:hypothetical protein
MKRGMGDDVKAIIEVLSNALHISQQVPRRR